MSTKKSDKTEDKKDKSAMTEINNIEKHNPRGCAFF